MLAVDLIHQSHETDIERQKQWDTLLKAESEINSAWLTEGLALKRIRDEKLYLLRDFQTFPHYYVKHLKYHKSTVSLRISAAETALQVRIDTEKYNPSQAVFRELSFVPDKDKQTVLDKACEISLSQADDRLMQKHIKQAKIELEGGYDYEVIAVAETWGFSKDIEKMQIAQEWYTRGKDNTDSKFWSLAGSGVIDPSDGKPAIEFAIASISDIQDVSVRWQRSKIQSDNPNPPIEGIVNKIELIVDGQVIKLPIPIIGKKAKIIIKVLE